MEKQKHMDINTRSTLQAELDKGTSFKEIGRILGKDCEGLYYCFKRGKETSGL